MDLSTANTFFTTLTFLANIAFLAIVVIGVIALFGGSARRFSTRAARLLGARARVAALVVAAVTTAGSLYYSEVKGLIPCELCWFQRICMYPLVAILAIGVIRKDRAVIWYAMPFFTIGAPLALYHWLVERVPSLDSSTSCTLGVPCNVPYFEELGYITLAFMDMSAFLLIGALLWMGRAGERANEEAAT